MSEEDLKSLLARNPALKIRDLSPYSKKNTGHEAIKAPQQPVNKEGKVLKSRSPKYRNHKVYVYADGYADISGKETGHGKVTTVYDSQKEFRRHFELMTLEKTGKIHDLQRQYPLEIQPAFSYQGKRIQAITYKADFLYYKKGAASPTVEDVKGFDIKTGKHITTKDFNLKWKLLKFRYPTYDFEIF